MTRFRTGWAVAMLAALGGCASLMGSTRQSVSVQTILDNREIGGVGCVLSNKAGRWFVTSPGRVTIQKSAGDLAVDCRKHGVGSGADLVASKPGSGALIGNVVFTGGLGYFYDRRTGAGFDYPDTLTIIMREPAAAQAESPAASGNVVY